MSPESSSPPSRSALERVAYRALRTVGALPPRVQRRLSGRPPVQIDGLTLAADVQLGLSLIDLLPESSPADLTPEEARRGTRLRAAIVGEPDVQVASAGDITIDGAEGPLRARHYVPRESTGTQPLLVYFHGGGHVTGDLDTHDGLCRILCREIDAQVLAVDYRLAPEHPFPAAVDDARAALRWAIANATSLGADRSSVCVGGDSAGGNLAAVVSQSPRGEPGGAPALQLLIYPVADATVNSRSYELFAEGFYLTREQMQWYIENYAAGNDLTDPRISPLLAPNLSDLAPAIVVTAGFDVLRDEGEAYAAKLREAGVPVTAVRFPGLVHGFVNAAGISRSCRDALMEICEVTRTMLATR